MNLDHRALLFIASRRAVLSGTAIASIDEDDIVAGGKTIIITLSNDTWVAAGATFDAQRQNIIDGFDSAQSEMTGWNAEVRDMEDVTAVVRTSDEVVTWTLTAAPGHNITAQETITGTIPATAVSSGQAIVASPTFTVDIVSHVGIPTHLTRSGYQTILRRTMWRRADPIPAFIMLNSRQPVVPLRDLRGITLHATPPYTAHNRTMRWYKQTR